MAICSATIRPVSDFARINVRAGAGTQYAVVTEITVGTGGLKVLEVQPDERGNSVNGRVYQWFRLALPDNRTGWVRDDLIEIQGDCETFGYGVIGLPVRAANLTRDLTPDKPAPPEDPAETLRVRKAAFAITAGFEGGGYDTYQTYDKGIVSYGRFQCTLASGSLEQLLDRYLQKATGSSADQLKAQFIARVKAKDALLRTDAAFKTLLLRLSRDPLMQETQDQYATDAYWNPAIRQSALPRGIKTPLGLAMVFDMAVNSGNWGAESLFLRPAELSLGAGIKSMLGQNGLMEERLIRRTAEIRRDRLYLLAAANNWGGLRPRADFWLILIADGDWALQGDDAGNVTLRQGQKVQVRKP
jgi:hypothetical protein